MPSSDIDNPIVNVPCLSNERQQDASRYRLTDSQIWEVVRIQRNICDGKGTFAADNEVMALWKSCGL